MSKNYYSLTCWRVESSEELKEILPNYQQYILYIYFPSFSFDSYDSALDFAKNKIISLNYYDSDNDPQQIILSSFFFDHEEWKRNFPYLSISTSRPSRSNGKDKSEVGKNRIHICKTGERKSDISLLKFADFLPDNTSFIKVLADAVDFNKNLTSVRSSLLSQIEKMNAE